MAMQQATLFRSLIRNGLGFNGADIGRFKRLAVFLLVANEIRGILAVCAIAKAFAPGLAVALALAWTRH
jgi:hypothetical protein